MNVDIWSDVSCPWCYIGATSFGQALAAFPHRDEVQVTWHSYQLNPNLEYDYPGTYLEYLAEVRGETAEYYEERGKQIEAAAASVGLDYHLADVKVTNTLRAHQLVQLAGEYGPSVQHQVKIALMSAHFVEGRSVSDVEELVRVGVAAGIPEDAVRDEIATGKSVARVHEDIARASQLGLNGVPSFVIDMKYGFSGAQPVETFTQALEKVWDETHPAEPQ